MIIYHLVNKMPILESSAPPCFKTHLLRMGLAALVGAIVFVLVQVMSGLPPITDYLGGQIVKKGGYAPGLAPVMGWGIHLGVSLQYAALFGLLAWWPGLGKTRGVRLGVTLGLALVLGWLTTLVTVPAIDVTIRLFSGQGFPARLKGLNTSLGLPFWNHQLYFVLCWLLLVVWPNQKTPKK